MSERLSLQRELCFVEIIEGETDCLERQLGESALVDRLRDLDVGVRSIEINAAGCFVVVDSQDVARVHIAARPFNLAVRLHEECGMIVLHGDGKRSPLPLLHDVIAAFHDARITIVHVAASGVDLSVLVDESDVDAAMLLMESFLKPAAHGIAA